MVIKISHIEDDNEKIITCLNMEVKSKPGEPTLIIFFEFFNLNEANLALFRINELPGVLCSLREKPGDFVLFAALDVQVYNIQIVNY